MLVKAVVVMQILEARQAAVAAHCAAGQGESRASAGKKRKSAQGSMAKRKPRIRPSRAFTCR